MSYVFTERRGGFIEVSYLKIVKIGARIVKTGKISRD